MSEMLCPGCGKSLKNEKVEMFNSDGKEKDWASYVICPFCMHKIPVEQVAVAKFKDGDFRIKVK